MNTITTFLELMNEIFYDWGMTQGIQLHKDGNDYWINKTSIYEKDGQYFLSYKTWTSEVSNQTITTLKSFYQDLYENDEEFDKVLTNLQWEWGSYSFEKLPNGIKYNNFQVLAENYKYYQISGEHKEEISKRSFQKFSKFVTLLET